MCRPWRLSGLSEVARHVVGVRSAAEADGVEEVAVAGRPRVAAAVLGQTALCELGTFEVIRLWLHFRRRRGNGDFGLLGKKEMND